MAQTVFRSRRNYRGVFVALCTSVALLPGVAYAQCVATGAAINCTGSAPSYANPNATGTTVTVVAGATVTGPLTIGTAAGSVNNVLNNSGTIAGSLATPTVWFGDNATINNGSATVSTAAITASDSATGTTAITVGANGVVNNYGTLTASSGTPVVDFTGANGTFTNFASAPAALSGNVVFASSLGTNVSTFTNDNTAYGFTGNVISAGGNVTINNNGSWTGSFTQTYLGGSQVNFTNGAVGGANTSVAFTGAIATGDITTVTNNTNAVMYLFSGTTLGQSSSTASSQLNNLGDLWIGTGSTPSLVTINGNFTQGSTGTLNMVIEPSGSTVPTAGITYSQIYASGGTMSLGGTLALNIQPGFYTTTGANSHYDLLLADKGFLPGNFTAITGVNGASLPFISFVPTGCTFGIGGNCGVSTITTTTTTTVTNGVTTTTTVPAAPGATIGTTTTTSNGTTTTITTVSTGVINPTNPSTSTVGIVTGPAGGTQQAYQFTVTRNQTYYQALVGVGVGAIPTVVTTNELAIAKGLQPTLNGGIVADANTAVTNNDLTNDAITFAGEIDVLTVAQAQAFLDSVSPEGYLAYRTALHDQANAFTRSVALRMDDQNSEHDEDGWWFNTQGEYEIQSNADTTKGFRSRDNLIGFVGGYDLSGPHHVYGLAMNLSWDALSYAPGTMNGHNRDLAFAAYGAYDLGPVKFSGQLAYNLGHLGANKIIDLGTVTRSAHGSAGEHLLKATGTIGFDVNASSYKLTPFVSIEYAKGSVSGFTETSAAGTTAADLTVSRMNADRTDVLAGFSFTRSVGMFRPYIRAAYRNQIGGGSDNTLSAYFNGDTATGFNVTGVAEARHELDTNAGVNWVFDDAGTLFVGYQGTMRSGHTSVGLNFGIRLEF